MAVMANRYVIKLTTTDADGVIETGFLTKDATTVMLGSLYDAIEARDAAQKWVKGEYIICILTEIHNV